ncbi:hypothetical protein AVEN_176967-1 [Araneus ventricosus]|uniref:Uncharacterized protein n=1 Tax=Araneus ventricosus TaxID=182803 RepID=A0A4Y2T8G9_ARAVE|nr:hypothetical protein AVEN_176967-1 [Araneus ventricosus]
MSRSKKQVVKSQTPTGGTSYSSAIIQSVLPEGRHKYPTDARIDSTTSEETLKTPKDMHSVSDIPNSSTIGTEHPDSNTIPDLTSDSQDMSHFKTVAMKKRPKIATENQRQLNSGKLRSFGRIIFTGYSGR